MCGSGAGTFLIAPLVSTLLGQFGWRGNNRVMSLLCLSCAVFGLVMVPNRKRRQQPTVNKNNNNNNLEDEKNEKFGLQLLRNTPFLLMTLANIPNAMAIYICYTYLPSVSNKYLLIDLLHNSRWQVKQVFLPMMRIS